MSQPTIALVIPHFAALGIVRAMATLSRGLAAHGYRCELLVGQVRGAPPFPLPPELPVIDLDWTGRREPAAPLTRYFAESRPAALFAATHTANVLALRARERSGVEIPIVLSVRLNVSAHFATRPRALQAVARQMAQVYPRADGIVALSQGMAEDIARISGLPRDRITVIPNGVDVDGIERLSLAKPRHPWFGEAGAPLVLGVGRLTDQKDFPTMIRAFALLRERRPARLLILGAGPRRSDLEQQIRAAGLADSAALAGHMDNPFPYMSRAGVFVLSSIYEGFANVVAEALACGTPVVSTDCPSGPGDILDGGEYGILTPVGDPGALAQAIERTLDAPPGRERLMGRAQEFAPAAVAARWLALAGLPDRAGGSGAAGT